MTEKNREPGLWGQWNISVMCYPWMLCPFYNGYTTYFKFTIFLNMIDAGTLDIIVRNSVNNIVRKRHTIWDHNLRKLIILSLVKTNPRFLYLKNYYHTLTVSPQWWWSQTSYLPAHQTQRSAHGIQAMASPCHHTDLKQTTEPCLDTACYRKKFMFFKAHLIKNANLT